jgi:hypothetical protein
LESDNIVGGISRTVNHNGNRIDIGGHRFFSKSNWVMSWWADFLPIVTDSADTIVNLKYRGSSRDGVEITDIKSISWEAANLFEDNSVDFVFIDADHSYESVKKDIKNWLPKIKKNGIIAGHDFHAESVSSAVNELIADVQTAKGSVWYKKIY